MRIITQRIYRAFPELDDFTDKQCKLLMQRVRLGKAAHRGMGVSALAAGFIAFIPSAGLSFLLFDLLEMFYFDLGLRRFERFAIATSFLTSLGPTFLSGLVIRDLILRRLLLNALRIRIDKVRCLKCKYILIGQRDHNGAVTCPECGQTTLLKQLGLEPHDLIPPESAGDLTGRLMGEPNQENPKSDGETQRSSTAKNT